jgi:hypothetical protein
MTRHIQILLTFAFAAIMAVGGMGYWVWENWPW